MQRKTEKAKREELKLGRRGNNSVKFQAGWLSGGGVGVFGMEGREKLYFPRACLDKQEEGSPSFDRSLQIPRQVKGKVQRGQTHTQKKKQDEILV